MNEARPHALLVEAGADLARSLTALDRAQEAERYRALVARQAGTASEGP